MTNSQENNLYAVYVILNKNKYGIGIYFEWEEISKKRLISECNHNYDNSSVINFNKIIELRKQCFNNKCILKDENLIGIYESKKLQIFWNDFYCFTKNTISQKLNNKTPILDLIEKRLNKQKFTSKNIEVHWPQLENVIGSA